MNEFLQFLSEPLAQRSLWACGVIGFSNGFVSALVVLRRSSLQIGTLSCRLYQQTHNVIHRLILIVGHFKSPHAIHC